MKTLMFMMLLLSASTSSIFSLRLHIKAHESIEEETTLTVINIQKNYACINGLSLKNRNFDLYNLNQNHKLLILVKTPTTLNPNKHGFFSKFTTIETNMLVEIYKGPNGIKHSITPMQ